MIMKMSRLACDEDDVASVLAELHLDTEKSDNDSFFERIHQDKRLFILEERRKGLREWERDLKDQELQVLLSLERLGLIAEKDFHLGWIGYELDRYDISYFTLTRLGKAFLSRMGALRT